MRNLVLSIVMLAGLGGCGLHLRGSSADVVEFDTSRIFLEQARAQGVWIQLREILSASDTRLAAKRKEADYLIRVAGERITRDVLSVSPQTGKVEEFQLNYLVLLTVQRTRGAALLDNVPITLQRDFTFDQDAVLGNFSEEETLREELTREAAEQVIRRSSTAIRQDQRASGS